MADSKQKPFPIVVTLISIFCIVIMLILGFWQLDRKQQKDDRLAQIEIGANSETLLINEVLSNPSQFVDFSVMARGVADERLFFIDNKLSEGKPGYHVVQPLRTDYGMVLVNLGWVYAQDRNTLPEVKALSGIVEQTGVLSLPSDNLFIKETNTSYGQFPSVLQQIDLQEITLHLETDILPFILLASPDQNSSFVREWKAVVMSPEKHLGYAIQWFGLAVAALTIYLLSIGNYYKRANSVKQ